MATTVSKRPRRQSRDSVPPVRILVVGVEGVRNLCDYLSSFFFSKGRRVSSLLGFDHVRRLSVCQVDVGELHPTVSFRAGQSIVVALSNSAVAYEKSLMVDGTLLFDASKLTILPKREDVNSVAIPVESLAQATLADSWGKMAEPNNRIERYVMAGAVLAAAEENPKTNELERLFLKFHDSPVHAYVMATEQGYDWVQEMRMRGKSALMVVGR